MKQNILLVLLFLFVISTGFGQVGMDPTDGSMDFEIIDGEHQTIIFNGIMSNGSSETITFNWTKEVLAGPDEWDISFCDNTRCWLPFVDEGSVVLEPGADGTADVHLETLGLGAPGDSCVVRITVTEDGNPDNTASGIYRFYAKNTTSTNNIELSDRDVMLYPNPAVESFNIKSRVNIKSIALFDFVGRQVRNYQGKDSGSYSLDGLRNGMYLARIYDEKGRIIRTVRLHKR